MPESSGLTPTSEKKSRCDCTGFVPACSNFSIQYNYTCASVATIIMLSHQDRIGKRVVPDYPEPEWVKVVLLSMVFIGSVIGMLTMGYLGDLLGIQRALVITNALTVFGALASALLSWGDAEIVWSVITASRFLLGIGVGGNYPLSAAKAAQNSMGLTDAINKAASAFFWQGPGAVVTYLLGLALLQMPRTEDITSWQFRVLLGAGAIPALVVLISTLREPTSVVAKKKDDGELRKALANPQHWCTLIGTAGTWFLFDIAFYGTVIFMPSILKEIWGKQHSLTGLCWHALVVCLFNMAATFVGIWILRSGKIGPKMLNTIGFTVAAVFYMIFAVVYIFIPDCTSLLFAMLCGLLIALYLGPNIATFVMPVVCFPEDVRATFHGLSASAAKIGAMVGALLFPVLHLSIGVPGVMIVEAVVCIIGLILNIVLVDDKPKEDKPKDIELDDSQTDLLKPEN